MWTNLIDFLTGYSQNQQNFNVWVLIFKDHNTISLDHNNQLALAYSPGILYHYFWARQSSKCPPKKWHVGPSNVVFTIWLLWERWTVILKFPAREGCWDIFQFPAETGNIVLQHVHIFNELKICYYYKNQFSTLRRILLISQANFI